MSEERNKGDRRGKPEETPESRAELPDEALGRVAGGTSPLPSKRKPADKAAAAIEGYVRGGSRGSGRQTGTAARFRDVLGTQN